MSHSDPLVSIIIPAYNAERYIAETLNSCLAQSWQHIEVIVVDDGSTDSTAELVRSFSGDARVKLVAQANQGCSGAKNTGLKAASGTFIQYLDADDLLSPNKIEEQVRLIGSDMTKVAVCRTKVFKERIDEGELPEIDTDKLFDSDNTFEFLLNLYGLQGDYGMIQPNAFLIPKKLADAAGLWDLSLSPSPDEDGEYYCRVLLLASGIRFAPVGLNYYRKALASGSLSNNHSKVHAQGALRSIQLKAQHLLGREDSERVRTLIVQQYSVFIYMYFHFKDLCLKAEREVKVLGYELLPAAGGKSLRRLARVIGMKQALWVRDKVETFISLRHRSYRV